MGHINQTKLLLCLLAVLSTNPSNAQTTIDKNTVEKVASVFMNSFRGNEDPVLNIHKDTANNGTTSLFHVFFKSGAWCIVSAEQAFPPILAYGTDSTDLTQKCDAFSDLIGWYKEQIDSLWKQPSEKGGKHPLWAYYLDGMASKSYSTQTLALLDNVWGSEKQRWRQGAPNANPTDCIKAYNKYCPESSELLCAPALKCDKPCGRTPLGCGAVSIGQVMWYWQWPKESKYRKYYWQEMPPAIVDSTTDVQVENIARFLRDCGKAAEITYCCSGSWTFADNVVSALRDVFGYTNATKLKKNAWPYASAWGDIIKSEIDNKRPVIMYGDGGTWTTGHFFVVDGYRTEANVTQYHIND